MSEQKADAAKDGDKTKDGKKKSPMMLIGILAGVLVVLLGGSFFLVTKLTAPPAAEATEDEGGHGGAHGKKGKKGGHDKVGKYEVKDLILNTGEAGATRFLKISVAIEFDDPKMEKEMEEREYRIRDVLITLIGHKSASELTTGEARDDLRMQILDELNGSVGDGHITEVFFTDFIVQ